jgi:hypothetical protein
MDIMYKGSLIAMAHTTERVNMDGAPPPVLGGCRP